MFRAYTITLEAISVALLIIPLVALNTNDIRDKENSMTHALTRDVYGFWPYWVDPNSYQPKWGDLTYVMYYSMAAQSDGTLDDGHMGNFNTVANKARDNNVRVAIVVSSFNQDVEDSILANHRTDIVNSILSMLDNYNADGVLLDFPNIRDTNSVTGGANSQLWEELISTLYNAVKYKDASYLVAFSTSGAVSHAFRNSELASYVDSIYLWGYEFHWSTSQNTGAVAPYNDPNQYDIIDAVSILENYFPRWKIILGVPLYGYEWPAESNQPGAKTTGSGTEYSMKEMESRASDYGRNWDSDSHTPWYAYQDGGHWYQGGYDDRESLKLKWNYVISEGLGGTGLWSLSNEDQGIWSDLTGIFWKDTHGLVKEVYAFYPYWIDPSWYQSWYNPDMWNAVSYISYAYLHAKADGSLDESNMTNYDAIYNLAKEHGVKVTIAIDAFDQDVQDSIFAYHSDDFANNVLGELQKYKADGVNIDFELPRDTNKYTGGSNTALFENFMQKLHDTLKNANPNYHISFCVAYSVENVFRNANLGQYVNNVFLMGYDYYFQDSTHTGPVAPYNDSTRMDEVDSVHILENYFPK